MTSLVQDLRFALRTLLKRPGFTVVAAATLGLGIGANAALVSVVRVVLLNPLPYHDSESIVDLWSQWQGFEKTWVSMGEFQWYRDSAESFEDVGLYQPVSYNLTDGDQPERVPSAQISHSVLTALGVEPRLGRGFTVEESRDGLPVALLGDAIWRRRYGARPDAVGAMIDLNGVSTRVIGILPPGFRLPLDYNATASSQVYTPLITPEPGTPIPQLGGSHSYYALARLAPGVTVEKAQAEVLAWNLKATADSVYPEEWRFRTLVIPVIDDVVGEVRPALGVLLGAVAFVLWIACANVANLLLTQGHQRQRELAVRRSFGASRLRIARQLLAESFVVSLIGGVIGVLLAGLGLRLLLAFEPGSVPRIAEARVDAGTLAVAFALATGATLIAGLLPALSASRALPTTLRETGRATMGKGARRFRSSLVSFQMAAAVVLVIGAGLLVRTFQHLTSVDPGFRRDGVVTMRLSTTSADYPEDSDIIGFYRSLRTSVEALPGVGAVGLVRVLPLASTIGDWGMDVDGYDEAAHHQHISADWQIVSAGYFQAMGMTMLEGRDFTDGDIDESEPVVIVNRSLAERYWPQDTALGKRIRISGTDDSPWCRVVGVVADVRHNGITAEVNDKWYRPMTQFYQSSGFTPRSMTLVARTQTEPDLAIGPIRGVVRDLDPRMPVSEVQSLSEVFAGSIASSRFTMLLLGSFSLFATLLACIGVYGVVSYNVSQEQRGIGIRLALGASPRGVMGRVLGRGLRMSLLGILVGIVLALWSSRALQTQLVGIAAQDPMVFTIVPAMLVLAATLGCLVPAFRAARVDPAESLRAE